MKVVITEPALADLREIGDWIALDNPMRAFELVEELEADCAGLSENPLRFQLVARFESSGVRRRVHGSCLIFYRVDPTEVTVLRILHGARDYEPLIFPREEDR